MRLAPGWRGPHQPDGSFRGDVDAQVARARGGLRGLARDRALGAIQQFGGLLDAEVEPVPQHDGGAHPGQQGGEHGAHLAVGKAIREGLRRCGRLGRFGYVTLSPVAGPAGLVDAGVDDNSPDVGGLGTGSPHLRPGDVEPGQGPLDQVLGEMSVRGRAHLLTLNTGQDARRVARDGRPGVS